MNNNNSTNPSTLRFGVWEQHQSWMIPTLIWNKPMLITPSDIRRPYRSACETNTNLEWYQLLFWNKPMLLTPSDMETLKYNNLTNLTGMIWHIDPTTKILETNQFWKLAFRIAASFKSRKWPICLPEGSKGSIGDPTWPIRCDYILTPKITWKTSTFALGPC